MVEGGLGGLPLFFVLMVQPSLKKRTNMKHYCCHIFAYFKGHDFTTDGQKAFKNVNKTQLQTLKMDLRIFQTFPIR